MTNAKKIFVLCKLLPAQLNELSRKNLGFIQNFPCFFELPCILDGNTHLVCKSGEDVNILLRERIWFCALHIQRADDLITHTQGQRNFGAGLAGGLGC